MLELLQWLLIFLLGGFTGYLWSQRKRAAVPEWLLELQEDDIATRDDLDRYHHHVIQISQTQRDLINQRFDELARDAAASAKSYSRIVEEPVAVHSLAEEKQAPAPYPADRPSPGMQFESAARSAPPSLFPSPSLMEAGKEDEDLGRRAMALLAEGKGIQEIAAELRIGRQEAQLLIRMAQMKAPFYAGV